METVLIRAVAYREGGIFTIQGIDYDIVAHAERISDLAEAFEQAVFENVSVNVHLGRTPFEGIGPAPHQFFEMFEAAETALSRVKPAKVAKPVRVAKRPEISLRYLESAAA